MECDEYILSQKQKVKIVIMDHVVSKNDVIKVKHIMEKEMRNIRQKTIHPDLTSSYEENVEVI